MVLVASWHPGTARDVVWRGVARQAPVNRDDDRWE
jgi:hypothetical protein